MSTLTPVETDTTPLTSPHERLQEHLRVIEDEFHHVRASIARIEEHVADIEADVYSALQAAAK